ncbi:mitochondrial potassium channel-like [Watersipora subatra]|uniref:mitochondrial potassium channel-like n=1 Tax=Watersipora subatra TaxID=2589382 RepID=UPI00355B0F1B
MLKANAQLSNLRNINTHAKRWLKAYEDFVGLTAVKSAQENVLQAETVFISTQQKRREKQHCLTTIQVRLKKLNTELEKIPRTDDRYLTLLTEEHTIIKEEQTLRNEVDGLEQEERERFTLLSTALRDSHSKESAQAERTKYWSLGGSLIGACLGVIGSSVNNRMRMRQLKSMMLSRDATPSVTDKLEEIQSRLDEVTERLVESNSVSKSLDRENSIQVDNFSVGDNLIDASACTDTDQVVLSHGVECQQVLARMDTLEEHVEKTLFRTLFAGLLLAISYSIL